MSKTVLTAVLLSTISAVGPIRVNAQSSDSALFARFDAVEGTVRALERQVSELNKMLRAALPPEPSVEVPPVEFTLSGAPIKGALGANVVLIEFSDFQCPFCGQHAKAAYQELQRQFVDTGRIKYVFVNLPLENAHPLAFKAAEAAACAGDQGKFWEMHDRLFANQQSLAVADLLNNAQALELDRAKFQSCLTDGKMTAKVRKDLDDAHRLGLTGTPAFLIGEMKADGTVTVVRRITGAQPFQVFQAALEKSLTKAATPF
jgi:protein-disulfide isomerase